MFNQQSAITRSRSSRAADSSLLDISRLFFTLLLLCICGCLDSKPETLIDSGYDQTEMDAAIARAQSEVDSFIAELQNPTGSDHAVKAPIEDKGEVEHFWLTDISFQNGQFKGTIGNDPGT